jgi:hypothetical protein
MECSQIELLVRIVTGEEVIRRYCNVRKSREQTLRLLAKKTV